MNVDVVPGGKTFRCSIPQESSHELGLATAELVKAHADQNVLPTNHPMCRALWEHAPHELGHGIVNGQLAFETGIIGSEM